MNAKHFHIVSTFKDIGGGESHALSLAALLRNSGAEVRLWSDRPGAIHGATSISPFSGQFPRNGVLILLGTWVTVEPWIAHVRPERIVLICNTSNAEHLLAMAARLNRPHLPMPEIVYMSQRQRDAMPLPGRLCPTLIDLEHFSPGKISQRPYTIGRLSRDTPAKHHPHDISLYRMLALNGVSVRIQGGTCLRAALGEVSGVELIPAGTVAAADFLSTLDLFFYRTGEWQEPSGRVIMEALACGLPVVAHVSGGYSDWIANGENGYLFTTQEEAWTYLRHLGADADQRRRMGLAARAAALRLAGPEAQAEYLSWLRA